MSGSFASTNFNANINMYVKSLELYELISVSGDNIRISEEVDWFT